MTRIGGLPRRLAIALLALTGAAGPAGADVLRFMTGPEGGAWYPLGLALGEIVAGADLGLSLQVLPGAGGINVRAVETGKADLAFANSITTADAIHGRQPFEGPAENVCHLATLYPQYFQIVTLGDTGIERPEQLAGRALTTQPTGYTGEAITRHLIEALELSYGDLGRTDFVTYDVSLELMKNGVADVFTLGTTVPAAAIVELAASRQVRLLPVNDDLLARMQRLRPAYQRGVVPAGSYSDQKDDVPTISYATHLIARCDLDAAAVVGVLDAIGSHKADLAAVADAIGEMSRDQMATDLGIPFHPAARAFWSSP